MVTCDMVDCSLLIPDVYACSVVHMHEEIKLAFGSVHYSSLKHVSNFRLISNSLAYLFAC